METDNSPRGGLKNKFENELHRSKLRGIESVIPARPESFCKSVSKEGFPTSGNDKHIAPRSRASSNSFIKKTSALYGLNFSGFLNFKILILNFIFCF